VKELFSLENLKKVMVMVLCSQENFTRYEYSYLNSVMDINNTINEKIEKAA